MNLLSSILAVLATFSGFSSTVVCFSPWTTTFPALATPLEFQRSEFGKNFNDAFTSSALFYQSTPEDTSTVEEEEWDMPLSPQPGFDLPAGAPTDAQVEDETMSWIKRNVIGLNLCPFADRPVKTKELSLHVARGNDPQVISEAVAEQLIRKRHEIGTSLVITPEFSPDDFDEFMAMVQFLEQRVMVHHELHGHVQIAVFHPKFTIDGTSKEVDVYTNRSPYPAFHVLREDEVARAVQKLGGDPGKVWRRNKRLLQILEEKLGRLKVVKLLLGRDQKKVDPGDQEAVADAMQKTKCDMDQQNEEGGDKSVIRGVWMR